MRNRTTGAWVVLTLPHIVLAILICVSLAASAGAQICEPPIVAPQITAPSQVCPYAPATASVLPPAEGTWEWVSWSIAGGVFLDGSGNPIPWAEGSTVQFRAEGNVPVTLYASADHSSGCHTLNRQAQVAIRTIAAAQIQAPAQVCPYAPATASVLPPAEGTWERVSWGIDGGTLLDENGNPDPWAEGSTVRFRASGSQPVTLYAHARDSFGCEAPYGSAEVAIRTIAAVQIEVPEQVCPWAPATASVLPPAEGTWDGVSWGIDGGTLLDESGNPVQWAEGSTVQFRATGSQPVTLYANARDSFGCEAPYGSVEVPIRTIDPAQINAPAEVCVGTPSEASIQPPAEGTWQAVSWSINGGTFVDANGNPIPDPTGETVRFVATSEQEPLTLFVYAEDSFGCNAPSGTITIPTAPGSGLPPPAISLSSPDVCGSEVLTASVGSGYTSYAWSIVSGEITSGQGTDEITFAADGTGPVTVSVTTNAASCPATDSETLPLSGPASYFYVQNSACAGGVLKARAPSSYSEFSWTATNATIEGPADVAEVWFRATGAGPVTLAFLGKDAATGCFSGNSVTVPLDGYPTPRILFPQDDMVCPGGTSTAWTPDDYYPSYRWTVIGGTIVSGQGTPAISFQHIAGQAAGVILDVGEGECIAGASRVMMTHSTVPIVAELAAPSVCANGNGTLYIDNYDSYPNVSIQVTNGSVVSTAPGRVAGGRTITFRNNGAGDTALRVEGMSGMCLVSRELTATMVTAAASITPGGPTTFCQGGSVTLTANSGASYLWSNGATTRSITVSATGSYSVTVTNANGCSATSAATSVTVNAKPPVPVITPGGPTTFCQGGSVTLTAPAGFTYLWSTGATTQSIVVTATGSYTVTVMNASGCTATSAPQSVIAAVLPPVPTITVGGSTSLCPGHGSTLTAPAGFTYLWSNGATTRSILVSTAGSYSVTVTNVNGCKRTSAPVTITTNPPTVITTHPASQSMPRNTTRILSVAATGTPTLKYQWYSGTSGNTSSPISGATGSTLTIGPFSRAGTNRYWVHVTSTGCPASGAGSNTAIITVTN